jgi:hypothetical protein
MTDGFPYKSITAPNAINLFSLFCSVPASLLHPIIGRRNAALRLVEKNVPKPSYGKRSEKALACFPGKSTK